MEVIINYTSFLNRPTAGFQPSPCGRLGCFAPKITTLSLCTLYVVVNHAVHSQHQKKRTKKKLSKEHIYIRILVLKNIIYFKTS